MPQGFQVSRCVRSRESAICRASFHTEEHMHIHHEPQCKSDLMRLILMFILIDRKCLWGKMCLIDAWGEDCEMFNHRAVKKRRTPEETHKRINIIINKAVFKRRAVCQEKQTALIWLIYPDIPSGVHSNEKRKNKAVYRIKAVIKLYFSWGGLQLLNN